MFGVGCIPWSPLARGLLTRPLGEQTIRGQTDLLSAILIVPCVHLSVQ